MLNTHSPFLIATKAEPRPTQTMSDRGGKSLYSKELQDDVNLYWQKPVSSLTRRVENWSGAGQRKNLVKIACIPDLKSSILVSLSKIKVVKFH